ncbi:MAG: hypothetical protein ACRDHN_05970, partial [Thermomicrobiales bacterium]
RGIYKAQRELVTSSVERGHAFRNNVHPIIERDLAQRFTSEVSLSTGQPPKGHKFDLVAVDRSWVLECKSLEWRANGGVPSAKITDITEAASFLKSLGVPSRRAIVVSSAPHPSRSEALADYTFDCTVTTSDPSA